MKKLRRGHSKKAAVHHMRRIALKPKHAKPYRKRHWLSLTVLLLLSFVLVGQLGWYAATYYQNREDAREAAQRINSVQSAEEPTTLSSQLGFSLVFDKKLFAIEASEVLQDGTSRTFNAGDVTQPRRYAVVQISPLTSTEKGGQQDPSRMTIIASQERADIEALRKQYGDGLTEPQLVAKNFEDKASENFDVVRVAETQETINGQTYLKQTFLNVPRYTVRGSIKPVSTRTVLYSTLHQGRSFAIKIVGITDNVTTPNIYDGVIHSVRLEEPTTLSGGTNTETLKAVASTPKKTARQALVDKLLGTAVAEAADPQSSSHTAVEQLVARYTPSVVKIYHIICGEIIFKGQSLGSGCDGGTGTGFFISSDGYIATNGHVVATSAKDIVVQAILYDPNALLALLKLDGYSDAEIKSIADDLNQYPEKIAVFLQSIYELPDSELNYKSEKNFYTIALGNSVPDVNRLLETGEELAETKFVKNAELIGTDYNSADLITGEFKNSDVAILKLKGDNYPLVTLGSINGLTQGASLTVIGFPSAAENELTDNSSLKATATNGLVSAIRNVNGSSKKLVQSDVKIGRGNSGGPAFESSGGVIGLTTYSYASQTQGDSTISYIRDVRDLKDLISKEAITLNNKSQTQDTWEDGLKDFFAAHYSKAIAKFEKVKELYPAHSLANEYIAVSKSKIANGEEVKEPLSFVLIAVGAAVALGGVAATIVIIARHQGKHQLYQAVQAGMIQPGIVMATAVPGAVNQPYVPGPQVVPPAQSVPPAFQQPTNPPVSPQATPAVVQPTVVTPSQTSPPRPTNIKIGGGGNYLQQ